MKNGFDVRGDITVIYLRRRDGSMVETIVDTSQIQRLKEFGASWYPGPGPLIYVRAKPPNGNRNSTKILLHRFLVSAPDGKFVDHINHNTLDNRMSNLRIVDRAANGFNRRGAHPTNQSSGLRNITWHKKSRKWQVTVTHRGQRRYALAANLDDAIAIAKKFRREIAP